MALTGQIFATRVAVGLALPSPQAMQKAGGLLAQGIQNIHERVQQMGRARTTGKGYADQLGKMNKTTLGLSSKLGNEMSLQLGTQLRKIDTQMNASLQSSYAATKGAHNKMMQMVSAPVAKMMEQQFAGGKSGQYMQEGQAYMEMNLDQRREMHEASEDMIDSQRMLISAEEHSLDLAVKNDTISDESYNTRSAALEKERETLKTYEMQGERLKFVKKQVDRIEATMRRNAQAAKEFAMAVTGTVDAIRGGFNKALRNSLFLLTAIGYKLNQHTQDLIEYERELLNANSVFNLTNENLFEVGNTIIEFGNNFGIAVQNGAQGLYQLASAGVSANDALKILPETLKLSMAVQGDHNTISKLTAQTLFGFGMEMDQAAEVTDKFAYAIQKSLIEYQDLGSAVKFALPFFTSTGQSIDQLLGALQILTNRALEAGIAGRGLRQALAEFAEGAMDAEMGFRKMGVEILNSQGEMLQLTEIAEQFAKAVGEETLSNTELLTTLIEDLNVRGATAFIHLVQASDEFTEAVEATATAEGALDDMVRIQNESLQAQIQILKTNVLSIFALRDAAYEGTEFINGFHEAIVNMVGGFRDLIIVEEEGKQQLTEFGKDIQEFGIGAMEGFADILHDHLIPAIKQIMESGFFTKENFELLLIPLKMLASFGEFAAKHPTATKVYFGIIISGMLGLTTIAGGFIKIFSKLWKVVKPFIFGAKAIEKVADGAKAVPLLDDMGRPDKVGRSAAKGVGAAGVAKTGAKGLGRLVPGLGWAIIAWEAFNFISKMNSGGYVNGRANGGPAGGRPYMVGEQGPELFIPGQSGQVLNNAETNNIMGSDVIMRNVTIGIDSFGGIV